mgnify:CR=1 FL=1
MTQVRLEVLNENGVWEVQFAVGYKALKESKLGIRAFKPIHGQDFRLVVK